ncbi:ATP-binding SpoIIE family protein phosphatase [Gilvimarinus algae]|uniref:Fused response regulator/phosphatase n=1 Tax=Gilvimarinus algae TaxID=3058037 RepID=A0ABT8TF95_9GAMM|nr:fused response regulator/phosphatase [Gilvimarinus sp. SDUM040014]MDO3382771.1 fused response regulator/phosphatase [Gilvimarinus sp. SDUM040014]
MYRLQKPEYRILVIDDDEMLLALFEDVLRENGFLVTTCACVDEAEKALFSTDKFDLIVLDQYLDDGLGTDFLRIKQDYTHLKAIPVLMVGVDDDVELLEECFDLGVADYIVKPVHWNLLVLKVERLLNEQRMARELENNNSRLEKLIHSTDQDQEMAHFVYEHLQQRYHQQLPGVKFKIIPHSVFSGDIVLTVQSPNGNTLAIVADATGHGLAAALSMIPVIPTFASMARKGITLPLIVQELNQKLLLEVPDNRFVAAILVELDVHRRCLRVWNGGMPNAYWIPDGDHRPIKFPSVHMPLGVLEVEDFSSAGEVLRDIGAGELLLMSDGLTDLLHPELEKSLSSIESVLNSSNVGDRFDDILGLVEAAPAEPHDDVSIFSLIFDPERSYPFIEDVQNLAGISPFEFTVSQKGENLKNNSLIGSVVTLLANANLPPDKQQVVFTVLTELVTNSLDHGLLKLSSNLKEKPENFDLYILERDRALKGVTDRDKIQVNVVLESHKLTITVKDTGPGYSVHQTDVSNEKLSGRGIMLIEKLVDKFSVTPPGNEAKAEIILNRKQELK